MKDVIEIAGAIIVSVGGAAGLIISLSNYFGKILADRYIERTKASFQKEINEYQNKLDILKQTTLRYSDKQFEHYSKLWVSLVDLRTLGDELWNSATASNLSKFSKQLKLTKTEIERSAIFLEKNHYNEIMDTLKFFSEFELGKVRLIDYREQEGFDDYFVKQMITNNRDKKQNYERLITQIKSDLQRQIKS